jgi:hypothetical protein
MAAPCRSEGTGSVLSEGKGIVMLPWEALLFLASSGPIVMLPWVAEWRMGFGMPVACDGDSETELSSRESGSIAIRKASY